MFQQTRVLMFLLLVGGVAACSQEPEGDEIIDRAIEAHGGEVLDHAVVEFDFRGKHFRVRRDGGRFKYVRTYRDSTGNRVREVLNNEGVSREVDGERVSLTEDQRKSIETDVNSVVYFAMLPYKLNDPAVNKRYVGTERIDGEPYHKVEVTFDQEGGGRDHQDRFMYWIHQDRHTMDYLAYRYHTDGGGTRFRKAVNPRRRGGFRFQDYRNYTAASIDTAVTNYGDAFQQDRLEKVSIVALDSVQVRSLEQ